MHECSLVKRLACDGRLGVSHNTNAREVVGVAVNRHDLLVGLHNDRIASLQPERWAGTREHENVSNDEANTGNKQREGRQRQALMW